MSKFILRSILMLPLALALLSPTTTPVQAQGFFQNLFGGGQPHRRRMMPPQHSRRAPLGQSVPWWHQGRQSYKPRSRHYTAMCVRMCDGYYWPMSNRATRGKFYDLARRCETSCNGEAKLFYMPSRSSDVKRMTDLSGRAYEHINTAFLYRKKLVKSCTCKPMPWSYSARAKHMEYAAREIENKQRLKQRETQRLAALKRQQQRTQGKHGNDRERTGIDKSLSQANGRTIVESLDDEVLPGEQVTSGVQLSGDDVALGDDAETLSNVEHILVDEAVRAVRVKQRRKPARTHKRRPRRYSATRHRRRQLKPKWNAGFGAGKPGKVWPGDRPRPRRRYR